MASTLSLGSTCVVDASFSINSAVNAIPGINSVVIAILGLGDAGSPIISVSSGSAATLGLSSIGRASAKDAGVASALLPERDAAATAPTVTVGDEPPVTAATDAEAHPQLLVAAVAVGDRAGVPSAIVAYAGVVSAILAESVGYANAQAVNAAINEGVGDTILTDLERRAARR